MLNGIIKYMSRKKGSKNIPKVTAVDTQEINEKVIRSVIEEPVNIAVELTRQQFGLSESKPQDPQELLNQFLKDNNLKIDFDVLEGTIPTQYGIIKLEKPTLVIKASYV